MLSEMNSQYRLLGITTAFTAAPIKAQSIQIVIVVNIQNRILFMWYISEMKALG